jgi:hypothetical protein
MLGWLPDDSQEITWIQEAIVIMRAKNCWFLFRSAQTISALLLALPAVSLAQKTDRFQLLPTVLQAAGNIGVGPLLAGPSSLTAALKAAGGTSSEQLSQANAQSEPQPHAEMNPFRPILAWMLRPT